MLYDAVISLGLGACSAYDGGLTGEMHYEQILKSSYRGASGPVSFDINTGSREAESAMFKMESLVYKREPANDEDFVGFDLLQTSKFRQGRWDV